MLELPHGQVLAGYRIEGIVGRGGMGVVYRATQMALERPVALKLITPDLAEDIDFRERFKRESRTAAQIEHAHVIPVHEAGEADGQLYIAMRLIEGIDLRELIRREGRLEPARAVRLLGQIASALDAAHSRGLVHRDIKPGNVLIAIEDGREHAYLTDFGLSKRLGSESAVTQTGVFVGTVDYIAPEQIQGLALDARSDVYSLGCLLHHALTGRVPFERDSDVAKIFAHMSEPPPPLRESVPGVPAELEAVVHRAMAKAADDRYPSAGDLARAAQAAMEGSRVSQPERSVATGAAAPVVTRRRALPTAVAGAGPGAGAGAPPSRGGVPVPVVAGLAALAVLAIVLAVVLSGGDDASSGGQSSAFDDNAVKVTRIPIKTPSGMSVGDGRLWVSSGESDVVTPVDLESGELGDPVKVGDGPAGSVVDNGSVWVVNSDGGTVSRIDIERGDVVGNPVQLSSTSNKDSIAAGDDKLFVATPDNGRVVPIDPSSAKPGRALELPDGTVGEIAFAAGALWVVGDHATVTRIDPASAKAGRPVEVGTKLADGGFRGEIAVDGDAVWVAGLDDETVVRLDAGSGKVVKTIRVPESIEGDIAAADGFLWVVNERGELVRIDESKNAIDGAPIPAGTSGANEITAGGGAVWVTGDFARNSVSRVDAP